MRPPGCRTAGGRPAGLGSLSGRRVGWEIRLPGPGYGAIRPWANCLIGRDLERNLKDLQKRINALVGQLEAYGPSMAVAEQLRSLEAQKAALLRQKAG